MWYSNQEGRVVQWAESLLSFLYSTYEMPANVQSKDICSIKWVIAMIVGEISIQTSGEYVKFLSRHIEMSRPKKL